MDTIHPSVQINSPAGIVGETPLLDFTASDGTVTVYIDGMAVSKVAGDHLEALPPGQHVLSVYSTDLAGNLGYAVNTFTVDAAPILITPVIKASSSSLHTAVTLKDGSLWAWGMGVAEDGIWGETLSPLRIGADNDWVDVVSGSLHTVALKKDGSLWAWGWNGYGQLGNGTTNDMVTPVRIGLDNDWSTAAAGWDYTLALKKDGSLWAWGANNGGQLGDGTRTSRIAPVKIGPNTDQWTVVSSDENGHALALKSDGTLWSWGNNSYGQIGDGTTVEKLSPVRIGNYTDYWKSIAAGSDFSVAVKTDGTIWAWGSNGSGQLGNGTWNGRTTPGRIGTDTDWTTVVAGYAHVNALKINGSMWSWGANYSGQQTNDSYEDILAPAMLGIDHVSTLVPIQGDSSFVIKSDGSFWAWGDNQYGQLGEYQDTISYTPIPVMLSSGNGLLINEGAPSTYSTSVVLSYFAFAYSSVAEMQFSNDNVTWSDPEPYTNTKNWTLSNDDGLKTVYARFKNSLGNWSQAFSATILCQLPPMVVINPVVSPSRITTQTISGTLRGTTVVVAVNTAAVVSPVIYPTPTTWSCTINGLVEGSNTISVTASDAVGNHTTSSIPIIVDTTPPDTSITANPSALTNLNSGSFSFSATQSALFQCKLDSSAYFTCGGTTPATSGTYAFSGLSNGGHTFNVRATDTAGNTDAIPAMYAWNIDSHAFISTGPTSGGPVYDVVYAPSSPNIVYAVTVDGGIQRSYDGGGSWQSANNGIPADTYLYTVAVDPSDESKVYAGGYGGGGYGGMFKSSDGGTNWNLVDAGIGGDDVVSTIIIDPDTPTTIYAGSDNGIYKSINGGGLWSSISNGLSFYAHIEELVLDPHLPTTMYAASYNGVHKSTNGGSSWTAMNTGLSDQYVITIAVDPSDAQKVYAGASSGVFKSSNGGASWTFISSGLNDLGVQSLAVDPVNPANIYAGTMYGGIYKSSNGGSSWSVYNKGLENSYIWSVSIDATQNRIYVANDGGGVYTLPLSAP